MRVAAINGKVTIGFHNQCNWVTNNEYYVKNSDDGGATFTRHTIYSTAAARFVDDLQRVGDNIYVLLREDSWVYLAASANAGLNVTENLISVPSNKVAYPLQDYHYVPKIAGVGKMVSVIWSGQDGDDLHSVFTRQSTNSGATFGEAENLSRGVIPDGKALQAGLETLAAQGGYVYSLCVTTDNLATGGGLFFTGYYGI